MQEGLSTKIVSGISRIEDFFIIIKQEKRETGIQVKASYTDEYE